ncbi:MAG: hypothetical protein ACLT2T_14980 [Bilophila wadsworthia]
MTASKACPHGLREAVVRNLDVIMMIVGASAVICEKMPFDVTLGMVGPCGANVERASASLIL